MAVYNKVNSVYAHLHTHAHTCMSKQEGTQATCRAHRPSSGCSGRDKALRPHARTVTTFKTASRQPLTSATHRARHPS
eukprot:351226-Chlamydomonas_euryale.AAC.5